MIRYLLDTGIAGDFADRRHGVYEKARARIARGDRIGIGMPVLAELYAGVELSDSRERNMQKLTAALSVWTVWPFDEDAAEEYGRVYAALRRLGRAMQVPDMQIAAIARTLNCIVVSKDSDLVAVPGLRVENWAT